MRLQIDLQRHEMTGIAMVAALLGVAVWFGGDVTGMISAQTPLQEGEDVEVPNDRLRGIAMANDTVRSFVTGTDGKYSESYSSTDAETVSTLQEKRPSLYSEVDTALPLHQATYMYQGVGLTVFIQQGEIVDIIRRRVVNERPVQVEVNMGG